MGETYTVRGKCACTIFWKNSETQISRSIMHRQKNCMHNMQPMYAQWWHRVWTTFGGMVQHTFRCQLQYEANTRWITAHEFIPTRVFFTLIPWQGNCSIFSDTHPPAILLPYALTLHSVFLHPHNFFCRLSILRLLPTGAGIWMSAAPCLQI